MSSRFFSGDPVETGKGNSRFFSDISPVSTPDPILYEGVDLSSYGNLIKDDDGLIFESVFNLDNIAAENQSGAIQLAKAVPRVVGGAALKLGQGIAMLGSAIGLGLVEGLQEVAPNYVKEGDAFTLENITDNAIVNSLFKAEEAMKESPWFKIYKPSDWDDRTIWQQLGSTAWWADEFSDGAAFALQAWATAGAIGGLGMGSKAATGLLRGRQAEALFGMAERAAGQGAKAATMGARSNVVRGIAQQFARGLTPDKIGQYGSFIAQTGIMTAQESLFEARDTGHQVQAKLLQEAGYDVGGMSPEEQLELIDSLPEEEREVIKQKKGEAMQNTFIANMGALAFSNAIEVAALNKLMGKGLRNLTGSTKGSARKGINLGDDIYDAASSIERKGIQRFIGRGSRGRMIGTELGKQVLSEGLFEENIQHSIQNISQQFDGEGVVDYLGDVLDDMVSNTFSGDKEAWKSIVAGALIGGPMGAFAGNSQYKNKEKQKTDIIAKINETKANLNNIKGGQLYQKDENGEIIFEEDGVTPKVNIDVVSQLAANQNKAVDLAELQDLYKEAGNEDMAEVLRNKAVTDVALSYMEAGFEEDLITQMRALSTVGEKGLAEEGLNDSVEVKDDGQVVTPTDRAAEMLKVAEQVRDDYKAITSIIPDNEQNSLRINTAVRINSDIRKLSERRDLNQRKIDELSSKFMNNPVIAINQAIDELKFLQEEIKQSPLEKEQLKEEEAKVEALKEKVKLLKETNKDTLEKQGIEVPIGLQRVLDSNPLDPQKIALSIVTGRKAQFDLAIKTSLEEYKKYLTDEKYLEKKIADKLEKSAAEVDEKLKKESDIKDLKPGDFVELTDKNGVVSIAPVRQAESGALSIGSNEILEGFTSAYSSIRLLSPEERQDYIENQAHLFRVDQLRNRIKEIQSNLKHLTETQEKEVEKLIGLEDDLSSLRNQRITKKTRLSEKTLNNRITSVENLISSTQEEIDRYQGLIQDRNERIQEIEALIESGEVVTNVDSLREELNLINEEGIEIGKAIEHETTFLNKLKEYYNFLKDYWKKMFPNKRRIFQDYEDASAVIDSPEMIEMRTRVNRGIRQQWNDSSELGTQEEEFVVGAINKAVEVGEEYSNFKRDMEATASDISEREEALKELIAKRDRLRKLSKHLNAEIKQYEGFLNTLLNPGVFKPVSGQEETDRNRPTVNGSYKELDEDFRAKKDIANGLFTTTGHSGNENYTPSPSMQRWFKWTETAETKGVMLLPVTINHPVFGLGKELDVFSEEPEAFRTENNVKVIPIETTDALAPGGIRPTRIDGNIVSTSLIEIRDNQKSIEDFKFTDGTQMFHNKHGLSKETISSVIEDYRNFINEIKKNPDKPKFVSVTGKSWGRITTGPAIPANQAFGGNVSKLRVSTKKDVNNLGTMYQVELGMGYVRYKGRPIPAQTRKINFEESVAILKALKSYADKRGSDGGKILMDLLTSTIFVGKSSNPEFSTYFVRGNNEFAFGNNTISILDLKEGVFDDQLLLHLQGLNHQISIKHLERAGNFKSILGNNYSTYSEYLMNPVSNNRQDMQVPVKFEIIPPSSDVNVRQINGMYLKIGGQTKYSSVKKKAQTKVVPATKETKEEELSYDTQDSLVASANANAAKGIKAGAQSAEQKAAKAEMAAMLAGEAAIIRAEMEAERAGLVNVEDNIAPSSAPETPSSGIEGLDDILNSDKPSIVGGYEIAEEDNSPEQGEANVVEDSIEQDDSSLYDAFSPVSPEDLKAIMKDSKGPFLLTSRAQGSRTADVQKEISELQRLVGSDALAQIVSGLIQGKAFGQTLEDGRILLSDMMAEGTAYHEAFHRVFSGIISEEEARKILDERKGDRDISDFNLEEELAEEFRDYMLTNSQPIGLLGRIFKTIRDFLRGILGIPTSTRDQLFYKIRQGIYRDAVVWRPIVGDKFMEAPSDSSLLRDTYGTVVEREVFEGMTFGLMNNLLGSNFNVDDVLNFNQGALERVDEDRFRNIYLSTLQSAIKGIHEANVKKPSYQDKVVPIIKTLIAELQTMQREGNSKLFTDFNNYLKRYGIELKEEQDNAPLEEGERGKDTLGIIEAVEFNVKAGVPNEIKLALVSIPDLTKDGKLRVNDLGLPRLSNYKRNLAILHNGLAGLDSIEEMRDEVIRMSNEYPEFKKFLERLNIPESGQVTTSFMSVQDVRLQTKFKQQFDKANRLFHIHFYNEDGNSYLVDANNDRASNIVRLRWQANFRQLPQENLKLVEGRYVLDPSYFEKYSKNINQDNVFDFYRDIGFTFSNENRVDIDNLVDLSKHLAEVIKTGEIDDLFNPDLDIKGWMKRILEEEVKTSLDATDNQHINSDKKTVYNISLNSYIDLLARKINRGTADFLKWNPETNTGNPMTRNSNILGRGYKIKIEVLDGSNVEDDRSVDGKITAKLNRAETSVQQFTAVMNGVFPFIRQSDRKIEYAVSFESPEGRVGTSGLGVDTIEGATEVFKNYLADEMLATWMLVSDKKGTNISTYKSVGKELRIFKGVLNNKSQKEFDALLSEDYTVERAITRIDAIVNDKKGKVGVDIQNFLRRKVEATLEEFVTNGVLTRTSEGYVNNGLPSEIVTEATSSADAINSVMERFTFNYLMGNIEQEKLFTGDVAFYKDFFKRTGGLGGTGKTMRNDAHFNEWLQDNMSRPDKDIDGRIETWVYNNVEVKSSMFDEYVRNLVEHFELDSNSSIRLLDAYSRYDEADAQGFITLPEYREMLFRAGEWSESQELVYERAIRNERLTPEEVLTLPVLKPQYFGPQEIEGLYVPTFYKLSLMPLIPSVISSMSENSNLVKLNNDMLNNGVGISTFESGNKVGKLDSQSFYNEDGDYNTGEKVIQIVNYDYMKIQLDMSPEKHHRVTFGTQFRKLVLSNLVGKQLYKSSGPKSKKGEEVIAEYNRLVEELVDTELDSILNKLKAEVKENTIKVNREELTKLLSDEAFSRNAPNNVIDDIREVIGKGKGVEMMVTRNKMESILMSIIDNNVIHHKVLGDMLVQASSTGFESRPRTRLQNDVKGEPWASQLDTLKFYKYGVNGTSSMEVFLPHRFKEMYGRDLDISQIDKRLLQIVGFRIPTQGLNSIESITIKGFLPQEAGNTIIVPSEIVAKAGSDFDIDKLTVFLSNYRIKRNNAQLKKDFISSMRILGRFSSALTLGVSNEEIVNSDLNVLEELEREGNLTGTNQKIFNMYRDFLRSSQDNYVEGIEYIEYNEENLNSPSRQTRKKAIQNRIIELSREIILAPENFKDLITPVSSEILKAEARMMKSLKPSLIDELAREKYMDFDYIMSVREDYLTGKDGVGIAASNLTHHVLAQLAGLSIAPGQTIINLDHNMSKDGGIDLSQVFSVDNKENPKAPSILDTISAFLNGYVDIAKDPFLKALNVDTETGGVFLYLVRAGVPIRQTVLFMNQPIILDYLKNKKLGRSMFRAAKGENKKLKEIEQETRINYGPIGFSTGDTIEREAYLKMLTISSMSESIKGTIKGEPFNKMQNSVLNDYLEYEKASSKLLELSQATNSDTRGTGPTLFTANDLLNRFEEIKVDGYFENVDKFENGTIIGAFNKAVDAAVKTYSPLFPVLQNEGVRKIIDDIIAVTDTSRISRDSKERIAKLVENDFISYLFQHGTTNTGALKGSQIRDYFSGSKSLPKRVARIKASKDPIRNNLLIQELYPILSSTATVLENRNDFDNLKFVSKRIIKEHADDITQAWEELFNLQPELATQLFNLALLQSSFNNSPIEFLKYAPPRFTADILGRDLQKALTGDIDIELFTERFFKNNTSNRDLVPYVKSGKFLKADGTLSVLPHFGNYPLVQSVIYQGRGKNKTKKRIYLENTNTENKDGFPVFRLTGVLGNGYFFKEYTTNISVIAENRLENNRQSRTVSKGDVVSKEDDFKSQIMNSSATDEVKGKALQMLERAKTDEQKAEIVNRFCNS